MFATKSITAQSRNAALFAFAASGACFLAWLILATTIGATAAPLIASIVFAVLCPVALAAPAVAKLAKPRCHQTFVATYGAHSYAVEYNLGGAR